jgi:hypothetical protein
VATTRISTWPADVRYQAAWNVGPLSTLPPWWTDITPRALGPWSTTHGFLYEENRPESGTWLPVLDNRDGSFDPGNPAGQYAPNVAPYKGCRAQLLFGINELSADQATAGEQTPLLGNVPSQLNVQSDAAAASFQIVTSGTAFQGTQVYQAALLTGATVGASPLRVVSVPCVPGQQYAFQAQVRIPSGNSVSTQAEIIWFNQAGTQVGTVAGTAQTLVSGSATWVQLSAAGLAPQGVFSAQLSIQIAAGTLTGTTTWQLDGLQWENSQAATTWQMPQTLGANLLPRQIATGTATIDPTKDSAAAWFYPSIGSVAQATNLTPAPTGHTTALAWTSPIGTTSASPCYGGVVGPAATDPLGPVADCVQVTATQQYTFSLYLMRAASADATIQVQAALRWYNATGGVISSSAGAAVTVAVGSWIRATVTATAPAGAIWARPRFSISTPASTTAQNTLYAVGWQLEQAGAASTWVDPGYVGYAFWGAFEQLPQKWRLSETWGETDAVGVDALAGLAQLDVKQPFIHELLVTGSGPNFIYALDDPSGASSCVDAAGNRIPAPIENSPFGAGSLTLGNAITSTTPGFAFQGTTSTVGTFANNPAGSGASVQEAETFVSIHKTTTTPGPPSNGNWSRLIHFRCSSAPGAGAAYAFWESLPQTALLSSNLSFFAIAVTSSGQAFFSVSGSTGTQCELLGAGANLCDGNWHQVIITCGGTGTITMYVDGSVVAQNFGTGSITLPITGCTSDLLGCSAQIGANYYRSGVVGDVALAVEFPFVLSAAQIANLYGSWRTASTGESSGARLTRLMRWMKWTGQTAIDAGSTQSMGPATDLVGKKALNAALAIADTEGGSLYATTAGVVTLKARSALYNSQPAFVFGERQALGEWPCVDTQLPTDPIQTYNIIPVAQYTTGQIATASDTTSEQANYPRTLPTRTVNTTSFAEAQAAAQYLLGQRKTNRMRLASMTLTPAKIPGLFKVCAQLEIGTRIRVMRRPPYRATSAPIQFDGFVARMEWAADPATGDATLRVEASPADLNNYWTLAALHTTLSAQAASGQAQATINALPDAAYNKLGQSLPVGYQLVFEPGSSRQETMTLSPTGIPSTSLGYSTAVLTFTSNFQFTHPVNSQVCEALPTGFTDPTTWDSNSQLGAASASILSGGGSGTNTVTVGPLPDAATNSLSSNWNTGDQVQLSPGTANSETATILSVGNTVPGYSSCVLTFNANLVHSHSDLVCDVLPAGVNSPPTGTCRLTY